MSKPQNEQENNILSTLRNLPVDRFNAQNRQIDMMLADLHGNEIYMNDSENEMFESFSKQFEDKGTLSEAQITILKRIHEKYV